MFPFQLDERHNNREENMITRKDDHNLQFHSNFKT